MPLLSSANSPKKDPEPMLSIRMPLRQTVAVPLMIMKNSQPGSLATVSGSPALALMLVVSAAILRNSPLVHPENTGTPFSVSTR